MSIKKFYPYLIFFLFVTAYLLLSLVLAPKKIFVSFLDVGQGDAIYIHTPRGRTVLVDGGKDRLVLTELSKVHPFYDRSIDVVFGTHPDTDHIGGLISVFENYDVEYYFTIDFEKETEVYERVRELSEDASVLAQGGYRITLEDEVYLYILWPHPAYVVGDANEASVVLRLEYRSTSVLLTGDIGIETEETLMSLFGRSLQSDILKAGHHGSDHSTSSSFVRVVEPDISILSFGCGNRYGHPSERVVKVLSQTQVYDTCSNGTISFRSDGRTWEKIK